MTADINRRTVLYGAAAAAATAALAACSNGGTVAAGNDSKAAASAPVPSPAGTGEGTAIGKVSTAPTAAAGSSDTLAKISDIPVGSGVIYSVKKVVVTQPTAGQYKCFTAICTHQGCTVGSIANGTITCPCHGSEYSIKDGSVLNGPATTPLAPTKITVTGDNITLG
jgi:Rieske Fe-S protein